MSKQAPVLRTLEPFGADPVFRFFLRRKAIWTPAIFIGLYVLLAVCSRFDGTFYEIQNTDDYKGNPLFVPFVKERFALVLVVFLLSAFVLGARYLSSKIVKTFNMLLDRDIIDESLHTRLQMVDLIQGYFDRRLAYIGSAFLSFWFLLLWTLARFRYFDESLGVITYITTRNSQWAFGWILFFCVLGSHLFMSVVWRIVVSSYMLRRVFKSSQRKKLQPLHPDRCCGLRFVGDFTLTMSGYVAFFPLFLVLLSFFYPHFIEQPGMRIPLIYSGALFYVMIASFVFLYPTYSAHALMEKERENALLILNNRFFSLYDSIFNQLEEESAEGERIEKQVNLLNNIREYYREVERRPIWPFDISVISRFLGVIGVPLLPLVLLILKHIFHHP